VLHHTKLVAGRACGKILTLTAPLTLTLTFDQQVERLDDPSLVGVPLAVTQFNAGGFVAVSYEARAAGIKCGDGVGDGGRAALPHLQKIGAVSLQEALRK
jgi:nucleotidyltransferase/DNA polymerase involved in DNA repair